MQQQQLYAEIQAQHRDKLALARAEALKRAEEAGADIKAPRGLTHQWHANFRIDEFAQQGVCRDICVLQPGAAGANGAAGAAGAGALPLRGMLVLGPGHSIADTRKMLLTELQLRPRTGRWLIHVVRWLTPALTPTPRRDTGPNTQP